MSSLERISIDPDLVALDDMVGESVLPERDWSSIIAVYNQSNAKFPIHPITCAKIVKEIKDGRKPKTVFKAYNLSYANFMNKFHKIVSSLEQFASKERLSDMEWEMVVALRNSPFFILGQDIERVRAFHFNQLQEELEDLSKSKPETFLNYMKEFHPEEFEQKQEKKESQVIINIGAGLLESI